MVWLGHSAHKIEEPRKALKYFKKALNEKDSETKLKMKGNFKRAAFYQMEGHMKILKCLKIELNVTKSTEENAEK